jgi:16S rRNA (cytidine1402-2'-O)-methyltransferase
MGTLYLVATPIGNLEDISQRALRTLREVRLVAAEDTRQTRKLFNHFEIHTPLTSYYEHNKLDKLADVLAALELGDVALVSDAGTPALNDPGYELVRAALHAGHPVSPIPGASAPVAALVASGLPTDAFLYLGYLPRKPRERQRTLQNVAAMPYTLVFLETPHRLLEALDDLQKVLGDRQIAIARELTKLHEEIYRGAISAARLHFTSQPPRGEITLVVAGHIIEDVVWSKENVLNALELAQKSGEAPSQLARRIAAASGWARSQVYDLLKDIQSNRHEPERTRTLC